MEGDFKSKAVTLMMNAFDETFPGGVGAMDARGIDYFHFRRAMAAAYEALQNSVQNIELEPLEREIFGQNP